jgi:heme-degrading monooxygenase HmoA
MLFRIWHTGVDPQRWPEYARFEREHSLPMFRQQAGCYGVVFVRTVDGSGAAACTFWQDRDAIERLATSRTYQATVARLQATGLLTGTQHVEVFDVATGALNPLPGLHPFTKTRSAHPPQRRKGTTGTRSP